MSLFGTLAGILQQQDDGTPGAFAPDDVATLSLWLDASDAATITATGATVTAWADKSANAYTLTGTGTPETGTRTMNSLNVIDFVTTAYLLSSNAPINNASNGTYTAFAVMVTDTIASGSGQILCADDATNRVAQYMRRSVDAFNTVGFTSGGTSTMDAPGVTLSTATPYLLRVVNTGTTLEGFVDGTSNGSSAIASQHYHANATLCVGRRANAADNQFNGGVAEILVYSSVISGDDITAVESYLSTKWGL